jgi:hypothetical protein
MDKIDEIIVMIDGLEPRLYTWLFDHLEQLRPYIKSEKDELKCELADLVYSKLKDRIEAGWGVWCIQDKNVFELINKINALDV